MRGLQGVIDMTVSQENPGHFCDRPSLSAKGCVYSSGGIAKESAINEGDFFLIKNGMRMDQSPANFEVVFHAVLLFLLRTMLTAAKSKAITPIAIEKESPICA